MAALPDYHAFCMDVEHLFNGAQPTGPIAKLTDVDWKTFRKISSYAQYWKHRSPREVNKLITFVMAVPVFSRLAGQLIVQNQSVTESQIVEQVSREGGFFILGGKRFRELFREEINTAFNEAKLLVSTFREPAATKLPESSIPCWKQCSNRFISCFSSQSSGCQHHSG